MNKDHRIKVSEGHGAGGHGGCATEVGGSGGGGGMTFYVCIFCGANHVIGHLCPEITKLFKRKNK